MSVTNEPMNVYDVGRFKTSVAIGRPLHRVMTQKGALSLAYWLIKECPSNSDEAAAVLSAIMEVLLRRAKGQETEE